MPSSSAARSGALRLSIAALLVGSVMPAATAAAQTPARMLIDAAFQKKDKKDAPKLKFDFKDHPELKYGKKLQIDFRLKFQKDKRTSDAPFDATQTDIDIAKKRIGVEGDVMNAVAFQIEREMGGTDPWRDVYVDFHKFSFAGAMYGKFKEPFSIDENTGATNNDFATRSSIANLLAPGRDKGWMVHGQVLDHAVGYEFGKFDHDGRNAFSTSGNRVFGGPTTAWRLTTQPLRRVIANKKYNDLEFGYAQTSSDLELTADFDNKSSIKGKTVFGSEIFSADQYVSGKRERRGIEMRWRPGPFSVKFENIQLTEERLGLSVEDTDLPRYLHKGWYVSGTWAITGEEKAKGLDQPNKPINKGGVGAVEVAGRVEHITFGSEASDEPGSTSPRARVPLGNGDKITTFGVNWYPIHWVKIQIDFIHEVITDPSLGPLPSKPGFNSRIIRFQFAL